MKKKAALIFGFGLTVLLSVGTGVVIGQTSGDLPRVNVACENKAGLIQGFDDGFSILKKCSKGSRQVVLGEKSVSQDDQQIGAGKIAFLTGSMNQVLKEDGTVWWYDEMSSEWQEDTERAITKVNIEDIVQWNVTSFLTKDGNVWLLNSGIWQKMGVPGV